MTPRQWWHFNRARTRLVYVDQEPVEEWCSGNGVEFVQTPWAPAGTIEWWDFHGKAHLICGVPLAMRVRASPVEHLTEFAARILEDVRKVIG